MTSEEVTTDITDGSEGSEVEPSFDKFSEDPKIITEYDVNKTEVHEASLYFKTKIEILVELGKDKLKPLTLSDCYPEDRTGMHLDILPKIIYDTGDEDSSTDEIDSAKLVYRQTVDQSTMAIVEFSDAQAQTFRNRSVNSWCQCSPQLHTKDQIDEILRKSSFISFMEHAEKRILEVLTQNNIADAFFHDLTSLGIEESKTEGEKKEGIIMTGLFFYPGSNNCDTQITSFSWHPTLKDIFIPSTICCLPFQERTQKVLNPRNGFSVLHVWSTENHFSPQMTLESPDDLHILKFNPTRPNLIVGGTISGQLLLWDKEMIFDSIEKDIQVTSKPISKVQYCATSNIDFIHKHGLMDLQWIPPQCEVLMRGEVRKCNSRVSYQIATCGLNGVLQFWDLRMGFQVKPGYTAPKRFSHLNSVWEPFHSVDVLAAEHRKRKSVTRFVLRCNCQAGLADDKALLNKGRNNDESNESQSMTSEFYAGCDDGTLLSGNFKLTRDETGKFIVARPEYFNSSHSSGVSLLANSPFISDTFLSAGGTSIAIWKHKLKMAPVYSIERHCYVNAGVWSSVRAAVFFVGLQDGSVEVYDLLHDLYKPRLVHFLSPTAITAISVRAISDTESIIVAGDCKGIIYSMLLPPSLCMPLQDEVSKMKTFVDRETKRVSAAQIDNAQDKIVSSKKQLHKRDRTEISKELAVNTTEEDEKSKNYANFLQLQEKCLKQLSLLTEEDKEILNVKDS